ncbi:hypothetical protein KIN20_024895 [Parelaphostrongylus tenuis]|uniref:Uncharacterized protein n=1 Tax=Parelaphostrongylus tenuis TaxID=148309 RepID=A0AAD5NAC4_PARTN|nr:hypothetical protein KIN20_024895 [Parelaphostrongylus tenuis]
MGPISPPHDLLRLPSNTFRPKFESSTLEGDERNNDRCVELILDKITIVATISRAAR